MDPFSSVTSAPGSLSGLQNKYSAMLAEVVRWTPPTTEHEGLKEFMLDQLRQSIEFDCDPSPEPAKQEPAAWLQQQLEHHRRMLALYERQQVEENARTEDRNQWIRALRDSVPVPAVANGQKAA